MAVVFSIRKVLTGSVCSAAVLCLGLTAAQAGFEWTPPVKPAPAVASDATGTSAPPAFDPNLLTPEPEVAATAPVAPVEGAALKPEDLIVPDTTKAPTTTAPEGMHVVQTAPPQPAPVVAAPVVATQQIVDDAPSGMKTISSREPVAETPKSEPVSSVPRRQPERIDWSQSAPKSAEAPAVAPTPAQSSDTASILADAKVVEGFAKDISLALALSQVVPPNYAYKFSNGVNAGQKVSWNGGKPWPQVLSDMLVGTDLQVVILGNTVTVEKVGGVSQATPVSSVPVPTREVETSEAIPPQEENLPVPASETKVARLDSSKVSDEPPVRSVSLAKQASEAQAAEASERQAAEGARLSEPVEPTPAAAVSGKDAPVVDVQTSRRWEANPGKTLRETLESWSAVAGADIEWMSPYDYPVDHAFVYEGKFDAAVDSILSLYSREQQRPRGKLYPNLPTGPSVLMIN